jgi:PAS domain S-box-containing protein
MNTEQRHEGAHQDGFALLDHELRFREVNAALAAITGVAVEAHLGRTFAEVLPLLAPTVEPLLRQVLATGEPVIDIELRGALTAEGAPQRWLASYYPVRSRGGASMGVDAVVRRLPALSWPEGDPESLETVREREHFAAGVAEASPALIYVYDLATNRNRYANSRLEELYGYTKAEIDAMGPGFLFSLLHPDDIPSVLAQVERIRAAADGVVLEATFRFRHRDGSWRWLHSRELVYRRDEHGAVTQVLGVAEDITARKASDTQLRWQADLLEQTHDAMLVWELDGGIVFWNRAAERLYGYERSAALGQASHDLLQTTHPPERAQLLAALEQRGVWSGRLTHRTRDGRAVIVESRHVLVAGPEGQRWVLETNRDVTESVAAEERLRRSEQRLQLALHTAGMVVWELDLATQALSWSPRTPAFLSLPDPAAPLSFAAALALIHPDDRPAVEAGAARLLSGEVYAGLFRMLRPDGAARWVRCHAETIAAPDGQRRAILGITQEVTALVEAQEALRASEERFRVALQGSSVVVFNQDRELRYTWIYNPALGYTAEQVIGIADQELFERPEDAERLSAVKRAVLADGHGRREEVWVGRQGHEQCFDLTVEPLRDRDGDLVGVTCAAIDITEHKRREHELVRANERLALALDRLDGFLYEYDADTGRTERSSGLLRVLGYDPASVPNVNTWWGQQIHPDDEPAVAEVIYGALSGAADSYSVEYRVRHRDGHYVTVWDRGLLERGPDGAVARVLGATIDVSERKQADAERAELLAREREARKAIEAALAQAHEATRERDLLISIAAHDLRTPLTVILGQAQLLQRRMARAESDQRNQRTALVIAEQAERLSQMIAALLDLSRIQEGRLIIQPEPIDLGALLERAGASVQATTASHQLVVNPPAPPVTLIADPLRLEQIFLNLLGNAVKYSPEGGVIRIWAERDAAAVRIHVRDQGIGIPEEALPQLFTRFYRAPNATAQHSSSLGVGLFIVRELAQAHGGTITAQSELGKGSTFTVALPLPAEHDVRQPHG